jgi:hypothetical protein
MDKTYARMTRPGMGRHMQQQYLDCLGRRETEKRWLIALMVKLLNISWDMWDHRNKILHVSSHLWNMLKVHDLD